MRGRPTTTTAAVPRQRPVLVALVAALAMAFASLGTVAPSAAEAAARVIITATGSLDDAVAAVADAGGTVVNRFDVFGIVVADMTDAEALSTDPRVATVEPDTLLAPQHHGTSTLEGAREPTWSVMQSINAAGAGDGSGSTVIVMDTGVTGTPPLQHALVAAVDTSGEGNPEDGFGHGTFMAGLIAGDDGGHWQGVAPGADLVSIKVANKDGWASISSVIAGLAVAKAAHESADLSADVLLLAAGGEPTEHPDALRLALRQLWADGLVVVVPSGNKAGIVASPGNDEYLLTAGAYDSGISDEDTSDDGVAEFSGAAADGSKPDLVTPGVSVVSTRSPASLIVEENPGSEIGEWLFRGSGTSMSAAITAGAAALILAQQPGLTPDEVKTKLALSADANDGRLDVAGALAFEATAENNVNGPLEPLTVKPDPVVPTDAPELPSKLRRGAPLQAWEWGGNSWVGNSWVGNSWVGNSWVSRSWNGNSWVVESWDGNSWVGNSWASRSWNGNSWVGNSWVGNSWVGNSWVGNSWVGNSWVGNSWVSHSWVGHSWV